jgi:hypothetical protein
VDAEASIEDAQLPGVLPDLAGLGELTLARGSLRVVTAPDELSRTLASKDAEASDGGKPANLLICFAEAECEKKRGDVGPSGGKPVEEGRLPRDMCSDLREGDAPVRGFLTGDGSMMLSNRVCLDGDRFGALRDRRSSPLVEKRRL